MNYRETADGILDTVSPWHTLDGMRVFTEGQVRDAAINALQIAEAEGEAEIEILKQDAAANRLVSSDLAVAEVANIRLVAENEKLRAALTTLSGWRMLSGSVLGIINKALCEEPPKLTLKELREAAGWYLATVNSAMGAAWLATIYDIWDRAVSIEAFENDPTMAMSDQRRLFLASFYGCEKTDIPSPGEF